MSVSIAMATHNGAKYLREQLESIKSQTRLPDELVICDDCSTDSSLEIVNEFAKTAPFQVRIFSNGARLGSTKNFDKSIGLCTRDIIALCDQDDIWLPEKLERQCSMLERNPDLGGVFSNALLIDQNSHNTGRTLWQVNKFTRSAQRQLHDGKMFSDAVTKKKALGCTLIFKTELVDKITPIPGHWEHDGWIAWMISIYSKLDIIAEPLIRYRIHPKQQFGVAPLSLTERLQDRTDIHARDVRQLIDLCNRIKAQHSPNGQYFLSEIECMIDYLKARIDLPQNRLERMAPIMRNIANYQRFSAGWLSAIKDFVR